MSRRPAPVPASKAVVTSTPPEQYNDRDSRYMAAKIGGLIMVAGAVALIVWAVAFSATSGVAS